MTLLHADCSNFCRLVIDKETGKPKGYGFCEYKDEETALSARRNLQGYEINGRQLRVDFAENGRNTDRNREKVEDSFVEEPFLPLLLSLKMRSCMAWVPMNDNSCAFSNCSVSRVTSHIACWCMYSCLTVHAHACYDVIEFIILLRCAILSLRFQYVSLISLSSLHENSMPKLLGYNMIKLLACTNM